MNDTHSTFPSASYAMAICLLCTTYCGPISVSCGTKPLTMCASRIYLFVVQFETVLKYICCVSSHEDGVSAIQVRIYDTTRGHVWEPELKHQYHKIDDTWPERLRLKSP